MSNDQGKKGTKREQKQVPASRDTQETTSTELTDADLDNVSGGAYEFFVYIEGTKQGQFKK